VEYLANRGIVGRGDPLEPTRNIERNQHIKEVKQSTIQQKTTTVVLYSLLTEGDSKSIMLGGPQSSSGHPSACYDAKKACIRLLGEGSMLEGSVIEMEQAEQSGTFLLGEVMEIVIMGDDMIPLAVHNERPKKKTQSPKSVAAATIMAAGGKGSSVDENVSVNSQPKKYVYDELRRAEIQSLMKDKTIGREEKLRRMAEIKAKYDDIHSEASSTSRESESHPLKVTVAPDHPLTQQLSPPTRAVDRWNRGAVAAVSANALNNRSATQSKPDPQSNHQHTAPTKYNSTTNQAVVGTIPSREQQPQQQPHRDPEEVLDNISQGLSSGDSSPPVPTRAANRWNKAAVATVSANALNQSITKPKTPDPQTQPASDNNTSQALSTDDFSSPSPTRAANRWNKAAVAAVSANAVRQSITKPKTPDPQPQPASDNSARLRASNRWNKAAVVAVSANTIKQSITKKPSEQVKEVNEEHIDEIIIKLRFNDPSFTTLILDGRRFDDASWEELFDAIEENKHLTELSAVNCGLDDSTVGVLVLALVENETLIYINLSYNEGLTDDTAAGLRKVLTQGNAFVKKINIEGTNISSEAAEKIQTILDDRDESMMLVKLQEARQAKIKTLLAVSASDQIKKSLSSDDEEEEDDDDSHIPLKKKSSRSLHSTGSQKSGYSNRKSVSQLNVSLRGSLETSSHSKGASPTNKFQAAVRANKAARQMANLGGEMNHVGKSASQLKELRNQRGECVHCGQKCFQKTMFKTIPLSIPNKVHEGRCLRCVQFE
jgi:hypothetical protein